MLTPPLTRIYVLYTVIKVTVVTATLLVFYKVLGSNPFIYPDLAVYRVCEPRTPNAMFSYSVCLLGIEELENPLPIALAIVINTLRDIAYIALVHHLIGLRGALLFAVLLAAHPFLALYHPRYVASIFASLGVLFVCYRELRAPRSRQHHVTELLSVLTLITFRYTNLLLFATYGIVSSWARPRVLITILLLGCAFLALAWDYLASYVEASLNTDWTLSPGNIIFNLHVTGFEILDFVLGITFYILSHVFFLTGFREIAYLYFPEYFLPFNTQSAIEVLLYMAMSVFHLVGLGLFLWRFWAYRTLCLTVIISLTFTSLFIVHLRYFIHFMPIALLGYAAWYAAPKSRQLNAIDRK